MYEQHWHAILNRYSAKSIVAGGNYIRGVIKIVLERLGFH